ncbi:hypothetical protein BD414DRAFT_495028 [Trametes punicea]|nr:hypothetical protein BD414DRAFT_495028 [Trametes punicea]
MQQKLRQHADNTQKQRAFHATQNRVPLILLVKACHHNSIRPVPVLDTHLQYHSHRPGDAGLRS